MVWLWRECMQNGDHFHNWKSVIQGQLSCIKPSNAFALRQMLNVVKLNSVELEVFSNIKSLKSNDWRNFLLQSRTLHFWMFFFLVIWLLRECMNTGNPLLMWALKWTWYLWLYMKSSEVWTVSERESMP